VHVNLWGYFDGVMKQKTLDNLQARAKAKLRYAEVHLNELRNLKEIGNDFDRAHQESFLYHLLGAKDAFLLELNIYYGCDLLPEQITPGNLKKAIDKQNRKSPELIRLRKLETNTKSWFNRAKAIRDHSTHNRGVSMIFYAGGEDDGKVCLRNPKTNRELKKHYINMFSDWLSKMQKLIDTLRKSAIQLNSITIT